MRRKKGGPLLGIDINEHDISIVRMRGSWPDPAILAAASTPTPAGAVERGRIRDSAAVSEAVRGLIERMGVREKDAVIGVAARNVMTRVLDVPTVPVDELGAVVQGEIEHQRILTDGSGGFDYVQLQNAHENSETGPQVLLMAAEELTVHAYREIAEQAGLRLVALEPSLTGMYRAASAQVYSRPSALCLTIGTDESEIAIVDDGNIRLYRRVDSGSEQLLNPDQRTIDTPRPVERAPLGLASDFLYEDEYDEAPAQPLSDDPFDTPAANSLAIELQRSIDYYRREYPGASLVTHVIIATQVPALEPFADWLSSALGVEATIAQIPAGGQVEPAVRELLESGERIRLLTAAGLAMRDLSALPAGIPRFDLLPQNAGEKSEEVVRRRFTFALAGSLGLLLVGVTAAYITGVKANRVDHEVSHLKEDIKELQERKRIRLDTVQKQREILEVLKKRGLPVPKITDVIALAVPEKVGLTQVAINKAGLVTVGGEAASERNLIQMLENLKTTPLFLSTSLDSFDRNLVVTPTKPAVVKFQISAQVAGVQNPELKKSTTAAAGPDES
jgi:type IV pilus assembly protein PilM